jgi:hypothetical protein
MTLGFDPIACAIALLTLVVTIYEGRRVRALLQKSLQDRPPSKGALLRRVGSRLGDLGLAALDRTLRWSVAALTGLISSLSASHDWVLLQKTL